MQTNTDDLEPNNYTEILQTINGNIEIQNELLRENNDTLQNIYTYMLAIEIVIVIFVIALGIKLAKDIFE